MNDNDNDYKIGNYPKSPIPLMIKNAKKDNWSISVPSGGGNNMLECELCGMDWLQEGENNCIIEECENIQATNRCLQCSEQEGDQWPDR